MSFSPRLSLLLLGLAEFEGSTCHANSKTLSFILYALAARQKDVFGSWDYAIRLSITHTTLVRLGIPGLEHLVDVS